MSVVSLLQSVDLARENIGMARISGIERLLNLHYEEIAHYRDIALDVDWDAYHALEDAGRLYVFTARIDSVLVGYSVHLVGPNMHYKGSIQALQDVLFVDPQYRRSSVGLRLIRFADRELRMAGAQVSIHHSKARKDISIAPLLERCGYEIMDQMFAKRLDHG